MSTNGETTPHEALSVTLATLALKTELESIKTNKASFRSLRRIGKFSGDETLQQFLTEMEGRAEGAQYIYDLAEGVAGEGNELLEPAQGILQAIRKEAGEV